MQVKRKKLILLHLLHAPRQHVDIIRRRIRTSHPRSLSTAIPIRFLIVLVMMLSRRDVEEFPFQPVQTGG